MNLVPTSRFPAASDPALPSAGYPSFAARQDATIFFRDILAAVVRRWRIAALAGATVAAITVTCALLLTPLYQSTASVMLDTRHEQVDNLQAVLSGLPADSYVVDSEVEVLKSPALARRVIAKLHLDQDPEFNTALQPKSAFQQISALAKAQLHILMARMGLAEPGDANAGDRTQESVVNVFEQKLDVERVGLTYVITITFWSQDAGKAARIVNTIAASYLDQQRDMKSRATDQANALLKTRVEELRGQVNSAERAVADYKGKHGLLNTVGANMTEQEMSALNTQLATAQAEEADAQGKYSAALSQSRRGGSDAVGAVAASGTMAQLRAQQAEVSRQEADLEARYGDKHPALIRVRKQAADIGQAIAAETSRIVSSLQADAAAAHQRTSSLQASINRDRKTLALNNSAGVRLAELERNADAVRSVYQSLLDRLKQTAAQQGMQNADAEILSSATFPLNPSYPRWFLVLAAALLGACIAAAAAVAIRELMDRGIKSPEDAENEFGLPVIATIPWIKHGAPAVYALKKPMSTFAEALRNLRTSLFLSKSGTPAQIVALMSAIPGEGKTTCTLALARLIAMSGVRVAVVDADLHRRSVTAQLPFEPTRGLLELLAGTATIEECLRPDPMSPAMILPCANTASGNEDTLFESDIGRLFDQLRERFDIVLVDTAPLLPLAGPRLIARHADSVVVLARWNRTSRTAVTDALKLVHSVDVPIAGVALTCVDLRRLGSFGYSGGFENYRQSYARYYVE